jgi:septal ring factor EnvC (AmiA/AmiB activator)
VRCAEMIIVIAVVAGTTVARADEEPHRDRDRDTKNGMNVHSVNRGRHRATAPAAAPSHADPVDPRPALAEQVAAETDAIDRALAAIGVKLSDLDQARTRRLRAAYRALHAPLPADAGDDDRMAAARRRAAARVLIDRDLAERVLLAGEANHLHAAHTRTVAEADRVPTIVLPSEIDRPARGKIIRRFGVLAHERSGATLSRRGLDFDVDERAPARTVAAGVVTYAGPIRGLDHGVVVDHGDYLTVVAKLGDIAVPVGARVARGDRLGRAARHRVYLELRVKIGPGGLPIDPEPLLAR